MIERYSEAEKTSEMFEVVRGIKTLTEQKDIYRNAHISLKEMYADELYPTAKYVLRDNLTNILILERQFIKDGIDIFHLEGIETKGLVTIAPPIVEMSEGIPSIVDGIHRCYMSKLRGETINVVMIDGVDINYPLISLPVNWDEVIPFFDKPEEPHLLRNIRPGISDTSEGLRKYYRDFSPLGSTGRRPRSGQKS